MTTTELLTQEWNLHPLTLGTLILGVFGLVALWLKTRRAGYATGIFALLVIAVASPLAMLAQGVLFSAHMVQHLLLLLVIPLFIVLALRQWLPEKPNAALTVTGWLAGVGAMWLWHEPNLCSLSVSSPLTQATQIVTLLVGGFLFWLPVWKKGFNVGSSVFYLLSACFACTILGIYIAFVPISVCPVFASANMGAPVLLLVRDGWGLSAEADQQLGGLMMWVPACILYLSVILVKVAQWYQSPAADPSTTTPS